MNERPSFHRRRDVLRLLAALAVPWVLLGIAYSGVLLYRELHRAGHVQGWMGEAAFVWFFVFGFPCAFGIVAAFLLGIYWLVRWRDCRRSWYGWGWAVLTWLNMGVLTMLH